MCENAQQSLQVVGGGMKVLRQTKNVEQKLMENPSFADVLGDERRYALALNCA